MKTKLTFLMSRVVLPSLITFIVIAAVLFARWQSTGTLKKGNIFEPIELKLYDFAMRSNPLPHTNTDIAIVTIDRASLDELGPLKSWKRDLYARVIQNLYDKGALLIGLDVKLYSASPEPADDAKLEQTLESIGAECVILPCEVQGGRLIMPAKLFYDAQEGTGALGVGHINVPHLQDDILRYIPLVIQDENGTQVYSFPYVLASYFLYELTGDALPRIDDGTVVQGKLRVPQNLYIKYVAKNAGDFTAIPFWKVYSDDFPKEDVYNKIVLVGATIPFVDSFATPISEKDKQGVLQEMPGVVVHANAINTILRQDFLIEFDRAKSTHILLAIGIVCGFLFTYLNPKMWLRVLLVVIFMAALYYLWITAFKANVWFEQASFQSMIFANFVAGTLYNFILVTHRNRTIKRLFGRYVSPQVLKKILRDPDAISKTEKKKVAILFSDIRSFTTMSESMQPEHIIALLNRYFAKMVEIIFKRDGTIDKFVGDAIMAVFGTPFDQRDPAIHAVETAIEMQRALKELNEDFQKEGSPEIFMGIGVHYGEVVTGNVGSKQRTEYTCIGDNVNTASRIESQSKAYEILISEEVLKNIGRSYTVEELPQTHLKGKFKEVKLFRLVY